ncbi:MAG: 3-deoxy-8-phosphooctulonate synthase [Planctomycetes bacterium]|nr:3-deoxy-8-phosphooctulonate synthase [Planctomycetota bacterium]MBM4083485.1 3-deoxy-8-phosphooctulonate synthase [Planctomycetota bacterium]
MTAPEVRVGEIRVGHAHPLTIIAGPCVIESEDACLSIAERVKQIAADSGLSFIFKASYDKANRTSADSYRGPGLKKGLRILAKVKKRLAVPVLSDVHCRAEVEAAAEVLDVLQIPAFLCRQTDLVQAAARTGRPVNIKKGQFMAPWDMKHIVEKVLAAGNRSVILTERGTCFGYNNLVSDMRAIVVMKDLGCPVIFDATHSVQLPGGRGASSGGQREMALPLAKAAVAAGCDGLFLEVHEQPEKALSDAATMIPLNWLPDLLRQAKGIHRVVRATMTRHTDARRRP